MAMGLRPEILMNSLHVYGISAGLVSTGCDCVWNLMTEKTFFGKATRLRLNNIVKPVFHSTHHEFLLVQPWITIDETAFFVVFLFKPDMKGYER